MDDLSNSCLDFGVFGTFFWIQRGVDLQIRQSHVAADTTQKFWSFNVPFRTESRSMLDKICQVALTSHQQLLRPFQREATRNAMASRGRTCQSPNCVSKALISCLVQPKVPESELLNVSALLAAAATRVRVGDDPS